MSRSRDGRDVAQAKTQLTDPLLPFLSLALDGNILRHFCQRLICADFDAAIGNCQVTRVRLRRARRCIIQYRLTLHLADGSEQDHCLVGYQYADRNKFRARANRLRRSTAGRQPVDGLLPGIVIDEISLLLQRFPFDHRLPSLSGFYFDIDRLVKNHLVQLLGSNDWQLESLDTRVARWRVGLSAVLRLGLELKRSNGSESRQLELFARLDGAATDTRIKSRLEQVQSGGRLPFDLAPTLLSVPQQGFTIQAAAGGLSLETLLVEGRATIDDARRLASVLAQWHGSDEPLQSRYTREKYEADLARTVRLLGGIVPACSLRLERLMRRITRCMNHDLYRPAHLDLKPEHIFFEADRITLIDVESAADAHPMLDIAILYVRLRHAATLYGLPGSAARYFALQLMSAYHDLAPAGWWRNFSVCYAWALLTLARHFFVCQQPAWPDSIEGFVGEAECALSRGAGSLPFLPGARHRGKSVHRDRPGQRLWPNREILA
ncbi:MAG: phosphotransferase [Gammaproteobacteria bacterium]|nr:phosphotransferase [Gammaproteobacteria bacterium]MDH3449010.1 phosphotransferase [Gammaproteobacteria bacterium]